MRVVTITVKPRCAREEVEQIGDDEYIVKVKAEPLRGRANKEALKLIARHLSLPFSKVMLTKGEGSPQKRVLIME